MSQAVKMPHKLKPSEIAANTQRLINGHRAIIKAATQREEAKQIRINQQNLREIVRSFSP